MFAEDRNVLLLDRGKPVVYWAKSALIYGEINPSLRLEFASDTLILKWQLPRT